MRRLQAVGDRLSQGLRICVLLAASACALTVHAAPLPPARLGYGVQITAYDPSIPGRWEDGRHASQPGETVRFGLHTGSSSDDIFTQLDADGSAQIDYGLLRMVSRTSAQLNSKVATGFTSALTTVGGSILDQFVMSCPTCKDGTAGSMTVRFRTEGRLDVTGSLEGADTTAELTSRASWDFTVGLKAEGIDGPSGGANVHGIRQFYVNTEGIHDQLTGDDLGEHALSLSFIFGQPIALNLQLVTQSLVSLAARDASGGVGSASSAADFASMGFPGDAIGLTWEGLSRVVDADGHAVAGVSALNAAGIDYARSFAAPVPEPAGWALMASGLLILAHLHRRALRRGVPLARVRAS